MEYVWQIRQYAKSTCAYSAHLKQEVREICKGESVEIFSLLHLENFNLEKVKLHKSKKKEEDKRHYRLLVRLVIGPKHLFWPVL